MNRIYRLVLNRTLGLVQVASELGSAEGKHKDRNASAPRTLGTKKSSPRRTPLAAAMALILATPMFLATPAQAATTLGSVTGSSGATGGNGQTPSGTGGTYGAGYGSAAYANNGGAGGDGTSNQAGAAGGPGGAGYGAGGHGGSGYSFSTSLSNYGGGGGGGGGSPGKTLGASAYKLASGTIQGGAGGGGGGGAYGGSGGGGGTAVIGNGFSLTMYGSLYGGKAGSGNVAATAYLGGGNGGDGGAGMVGSGFTLNAYSYVVAGKGGTGGTASGNGGVGGNGGNGGVGISGSGLTVSVVRTKTTGAYAGIYGAPGGAGGAGPNGGGGSGGIGGNGGVGISGDHLSITFGPYTYVMGGDGGKGGSIAYSNSYGNGGAGGNGGVGITGSYLAVTLADGGYLYGGGGGSGGTGGSKSTPAAPGIGAPAIVSTGHSKVYDGGWVNGGNDGNASRSRADAVDFSGGGNTFTLDRPVTNSLNGVNGNVVSVSGTTNGGDTLELAGTIDNTLGGVFVATKPTHGTSANPVQYYGFQTLLKSSPVNWTISNGSTTNVIPNWDVEAGTLTLSAGDNFSASASDTLTFGVQPPSATPTIPGTDNGEIVIPGPGTVTFSGESLKINLAPGTYPDGVSYTLMTAGSFSDSLPTLSFNPALPSGMSCTGDTSSGTSLVLTCISGGKVVAPSSSTGGGGTFGLLSMFGLMGLSVLGGKGARRDRKSGIGE